MKLEDIKIFVINYKKLTDRRKHIIDQFERHNIHNYEIYDEVDPDELDKYDMSIFDLQPDYRKSTTSLTVAHFNIYKKIIDNNLDCALIFEDDVILDDDFTNKFNKYMQELPADFDAVFLGDGCFFHIPSDQLIENQHIYQTQLSKCTDSYLASNKYAHSIWNFVQTQYKINLSIDHFMNTFFKMTNSKAFWVEPTIVRQGTHYCIFPTSL